MAWGRVDFEWTVVKCHWPWQGNHWVFDFCLETTNMYRIGQAYMYLRVEAQKALAGSFSFDLTPPACTKSPGPWTVHVGSLCDPHRWRLGGYVAIQSDSTTIQAADGAAGGGVGKTARRRFLGLDRGSGFSPNKFSTPKNFQLSSSICPSFYLSTSSQPAPIPTFQTGYHYHCVLH